MVVSCHEPDKKISDTWGDTTTLIKQRKMWGYDNWQQDFKDKVLCDCLLKGIGDKDFINKFINIDKTYSYMPVASALFDSLINESLKPVILKMKTDSLASINRVAEGGEGKRVFSSCMVFYKSKKLDSIVKVESKKWERIRNIDSLLSLKYPAF